MLGTDTRAASSAHGLIGREVALARIDRAIAAARGGAVDRLLLVGPPGSGRTALLDAAVALGRDATVLRANPVTAEAAIAYASLFDLCRPLTDLVAELPAASAQVLAGVLGRAPAGAAGPMAVGSALLALFARAAQDGPVLLVLDDADCSDVETLDAVLFAVRRLQHDGVAVVLASTPDLPDPLRSAGFDQIELAPLDRADAAALLDRRCPVAPDRAVVEALLDVAQGNPMALTLLPRSLSLAQLRGRWPLPNPLPSSDHLADIVAADLVALDRVHRSALLVVASSLTGSRSAILAALAALELPSSALTELLESGHLILDEEGRVRFARPLVRSVAYSRAHDGERRRSHAALAEVMGGELALEQRAWHLAAAAVGPDAVAAELSERAGLSLQARGASFAAAAALDRSVALSTTDPVRARRRVAAAETLLAIGESERARIHLDKAEEESEDIEVVAAARHLQGRVLLSNGRGAAGQQVLADGGRAARVGAPNRAVGMLCEAALAALHGRRYEDAAHLAEEALAVTEVEGASAAMAGMVHGAVLVASGQTIQGREALRSQLGHLDMLEAAASAAPVFDGVALALVWAESYPEARQLLDAVIEERRRASALGLLPSSLSMRALLGHRTGDTVSAFADAVEALQLTDGDDAHAARASALGVLSSVESTLGLRAACLDHVRQCLAVLGDRGPASTLRIGALSAAGSVELSCGRPDAALDWLEPVADAVKARRGNPGTVMWEADLIEALVACGRRDEAAERLRSFEDRCASSNNRRGRGAAARCRGLLAPDGDFESHFAASVEHYRTPAHPVGSGRTLLVWGERLAATGRRAEAIDRLQQALRDLDAGCAGAWAARAAAALKDVGAGSGERPPSLVDLPSDVVEVALLTAAGFDVEKVASHVLVSRRTVVRLLSDATAALGQRPGPALLRGRPEQVENDSAATKPARGQAPAAASVTTVRVLGAFTVEEGERDLTPPSGLGAHLVKLLAVSAPGGITVDEAVELLWPELDPTRGRARLRNILSRLRAISGDIVVRSGDTLRLSKAVEVDFHRFDALSRQALIAAAGGEPSAIAMVRSALALHGGELLPDSPYESWAAAPRERARRRATDLLDVLAADHRRSGRIDDAVRAVERAIDLDIYDEERYIVAAELRREQGRHGAAIALLQRARAVVRELGLEPSHRLLEIEGSIRRRPGR